MSVECRSNDSEETSWTCLTSRDDEGRHEQALADEEAYSEHILRVLTKQDDSKAVSEESQMLRG